VTLDTVTSALVWAQMRAAEAAQIPIVSAAKKQTRLAADATAASASRRPRRRGAGLTRVHGRRCDRRPVVGAAGR
jgi:hypothetical protein